MRRLPTLIAITALAASALAQESTYQPPRPGALNETNYQPLRPSRNETGYNASRPAAPAGYLPDGVSSASGVALISTVRGDAAFAGVAEPLQGAAKSVLTLPLNIAPLAQVSLEAQANHFTAAAITKFIVHAPKATDAARFVAMAESVGRGVVLVTDDAEGIPAGTRSIVVSPKVLAAEAAKAIESLIRENPPLVVVLAVEGDTGAQQLGQAISETLQAKRQGSARTFQLPPNASADAILSRLRGAGTVHGVVIADTRLAAAAVMATARHTPDVVVVAIGDTEELRRAEARNMVQARVWLPWDEILREAVGMFQRPAPAAPKAFPPKTSQRKEAPAAPAVDPLGTPR